MIKQIIKVLKNINRNLRYNRKKKKLLNERLSFLKNGQIPWSRGYSEYKLEVISKNINDTEILKTFNEKKIPKNYGYRLDERVVEYPWIFSKLPIGNFKVLDAGSTFNFDYIVNHSVIKDKDLTIFTYSPETNSFNNKRISYVYGDLRSLPFKDNYYDIIVSQSTIEHIDMDNSIYGYNINYNKELNKKSYEYLKAITEMIRVLKNNGSLLLTFPYGKFENHGFFQQFDTEMVGEIEKLFEGAGKYKLTYFKSLKEGWILSTKKECDNEESFNPHTGKGKKDDLAAHSRAICCVHFNKNK